jgi:hypothetical protein
MVNRRRFIAASTGAVMACLAGPSKALADRATPAASPTPAPATWARIMRAFKVEDATAAAAPPTLAWLSVWIEYWSDVGDRMHSFQRAKERFILNSETFHPAEEIPDAPHFGEESYALRGGLGPTTESILIAFRTGPFNYILQCDGGDREAFEPFAFDLLATVVARAEFTDSPAEAHLRALLPTEAEVGLPVTEEEYLMDEYTPPRRWVTGPRPDRG